MIHEEEKINDILRLVTEILDCTFAKGSIDYMKSGGIMTIIFIAVLITILYLFYGI